jgi:sarcosine oxidase
LASRNSGHYIRSAKLTEEALAKAEKQMKKNYDVAVIGAGVFGAWTAWQLRGTGLSVLLLDAYGPGNSRSSSGDESRIIRMSYGEDEIYTRWSWRALALWKEFDARTGQRLFHRSGVLLLARDGNAHALASVASLQKHGVPFERLQRAELERRYPQINFGPITWAVYEPESGALMARRAVQTVVREASQAGVEYFAAAVKPPVGEGSLDFIAISEDSRISAGVYIFACGPWLPKLFPELLTGRIHPTRQEVFYFGTAAGDRRFTVPQFPTWLEYDSEIYGLPDLEQRGCKVALDRHGVAIDPDTAERLVSVETLQEIRRFLAERFPALQDAPLLESRVCQYENTCNGDFLIDRHPAFDNVWLVGGGSGHGFKHGPALGEYVASRIVEGGEIELRFSLATKETIRQRSVY